MTPTEQFVTEARQKLEGVTEPPWQHGGCGTIIADVGGSMEHDIIAPLDTGIGADAENREFIIYSRTALPRALEIIERQGKVIEEIAQWHGDKASIVPAVALKHYAKMATEVLDRET